MKLTSFLRIILLFACAKTVVATEITIVSGTSTAAKVSELTLLNSARVWMPDSEIKGCSRIIYFAERKHACFAAEFEIVATSIVKSKPELCVYPLWLWFDSTGKIVTDAEPAVVESTILPGSPFLSSSIKQKDKN
jgi:hypothetical protein